MDWIDRHEATSRLGVKPQTLYSYVSRGLLAAKPAPNDPRSSLYSAADVAALVVRRRAGRRRRDIAVRAIAWGEPVLETRIAGVRGGRLLYRGKDAARFAAKATLEDAARLLWNAPPRWAPPRWAPQPRAAPIPPPGKDAKSRGLAFLAARVATDPPSHGRARLDLLEEGQSLFDGLADAFLGARGRGLFHERLARTWRLDRSGAEAVRVALVLVADHELNPSTFAARVAASTGASLAAAALAGLSTLTGPLHGEAALRAIAYLEAALDETPDAAIRRLIDRGEGVPGLGHALYPEGDPRAAALLTRLKMRASMARAISAAERVGGAKANIDMALAALTVHYGLPQTAPFLIFAGGRIVGWLAHAMEQRASGSPIRPRAAYLADGA